jgi:glutaminase
MERLLNDIVGRCRHMADLGQVASYIPELAKGNPKSFGAAITDLSGQQWAAGDSDEIFCLQSIAKVATLALALEAPGPEEVFRHVGVSAIADPFNSIMRLEMDTPHKPHNPMINSGAIVIVSLLPQEGIEGKIGAICRMCARLSGEGRAEVVEEVYISEKATSDRNRALAYFLKSVGSMNGGVEEVLDVYFRACSIGATARTLSVMGATLAADGRNPITGKRVITPEAAHIIRAVMTTCGMYDGSGEFAVKAGIPAKSGVGGGIMGAVTGRAGIGTFGPALDERGNSTAGLAAFQALSEAGFRVI